MKIIVIGVLVAVAMMLFLVLRPSSRTAPRPATAAKRVRAERGAGNGQPGNDNPYRSISVKCGKGACDEALALGKRRFLPGQLGKLPLAGCTSPNCQCKFEHHSDRRDSEGDKRAPTALRSELYAASGKPERRTRRSRRKGDFK